MLPQHEERLLGVGPLRGGDQPFYRSHQLPDRPVHVFLELVVTVGEHSHQPVPLDHREPGHSVPLRQGDRVAEERVDGDRHRIDHYPALRPLDPSDVAALGFDGEVLVNDPHPAFLSEGYSHLRLRNSVHGGAHDRYSEGDVAGEDGSQVDFGGNHFRVAWKQENVVESELLGPVCSALGRHAD